MRKVCPPLHLNKTTAYFTGEWWSDALVILGSVGAVCLFCCFLALALPRLGFQRLVYGDEGVRIRRLRLSHRPEGADDDVDGEYLV